MKFGAWLIGVVEYLAVLVLILDCNTVYSQSANTDYRFPEIFAILILILFVLKVSKSGIRKRTFAYWGATFIFYYGTLILYGFINVPFKVLFMFSGKFLFTLPLLSLIFCLYIEEGAANRILRKYADVMAVIATISLFFWAFASQLHIISNTGYIIAEWGGDDWYPSYFGVYVERQWASFIFFSVLRNQSIFCEGPMFSLCLVFAIASELFLEGEENQILKRRIMFQGGKMFLFRHKVGSTRKIKLMVLVIALITTFTTTGMILLIAMLAARFVMNRPKGKWTVLLKTCCSILVLGISTILIAGIFLDKSTSWSWRTRLDDYAAGFHAWLKTPVWGGGFVDNINIVSNMSFFRSDNLGYSNSMFMVLAQGGIVLFSIYAVPLIGSAALLLKKKMLRPLVFIGIIAVEFMVTIFPYKFLMMLLLAFCYALIVTTLAGDKIENQF